MAACGNYGNLGQEENCDDCVQVVKTTKRVRVPCTRNTYKQYTVKVPRNVTETVPRTVNYTDYESRSKQVPYQATRMETRYRNEAQQYQVPVTKTVTKKVSVTRKVPKTIYVDVVTQECRPSQVTEMQTRTRQVRIPYQAAVNETRYRTVNEQVPVQRSKTVYDKVNKTVYDTQVRTRCEPQTKYITKEVPVYNVIAKNAQPCGGQPCGPCGDSGASAAVAVAAPVAAYAAAPVASYGAAQDSGYGAAAESYGAAPVAAVSGYGASGDSYGQASGFASGAASGAAVDASGYAAASGSGCGC